MTPDIPKTVVLIAYVSLFALIFVIKVQSWPVPVATSRIGGLEILLLIVAGIGLYLPIPWLATPNLAFADYDAHLLPPTAGSLHYALGLWLLSRVPRHRQDIPTAVLDGQLPQVRSTAFSS